MRSVRLRGLGMERKLSHPLYSKTITFLIKTLSPLLGLLLFLNSRFCLLIEYIGMSTKVRIFCLITWSNEHNSKWSLWSGLNIEWCTVLQLVFISFRFILSIWGANLHKNTQLEGEGFQIFKINMERYCLPA